MAKKEVGTVKWFNDSKGFGFITRDEGNDLFVHHNSIIAEVFKTLKENAKGIVFVSFKLDENGEMTQVEVVEGISPELDKKAIEIAKNMPTNHLLTSDYEADKEFILPVKFSIR